MSTILNDRLKWNFEKALDEGRNVLVILCRVRLKGVPVTAKFAELSNTEKKSWGFKKGQIKQIESGCDLNDMDISLLYLIIRVFGDLSPGQLLDLIKQFKDIRNTFVHEKQKLSLDKNKLRSKLAELKVLYTSIFEELKKCSNPVVVTLLDQHFADISTRLLSLEATLDDDILEHTTDLVMASNTAEARLTQFSQATLTLDQASAMCKVQTTDLVAKTNEITQASALALKQIDQAALMLSQCITDSDTETRLSSLEKLLGCHTQKQESAVSAADTFQFIQRSSTKRNRLLRRTSSIEEAVLIINDVMKANDATTTKYKQTGKDALLIKAVEEADTVAITNLVKSVDELDSEMVSVAQEIAIANTNVAAIKLLDLAKKKINERKVSAENVGTNSSAESQKALRKVSTKNERTDASTEKQQALTKDLVHAVKVKDPLKVRRALQQGADPNTKFPWTSIKATSVLCHAVAWEDVEVVKELLKIKSINVDQLCDSLKTALFIAVLNANCEIAQLLLSRGAHPNLSMNLHGTPLLQAVVSGNCKIAKLLIDNGASPNLASGPYNTTPLYATVAKGNCTIAECLIKNGALPDLASGQYNKTSLCAAAGMGNCSMVDLLIKNGASVNLASGESSCPPLLEAAFSGHHDICCLLLKYGADPEATGSDGMSSIFFAASRGHRDVIQALINNGGNPQLKWDDCYTPADLARHQGHNDLADWLNKQSKLAKRWGQLNKVPC
ncbi:unnamed protein product [Meganyctiphanes norvegica]|uniref:Uncharacterized protein n=1 Tax=Meganyctiphanes norvegica TaxID=48144 RepID=A0AAV2QH17_MEGNR